MIDQIIDLNPCIVISLITLTGFFAIHIIIWHFQLFKNRGVFLIVKVAAFSYLITGIVGNVYLKIPATQHIWVSAPIVLFIIMLYLHFYVGVDRSVSVRLLGELVKTKTGKLKLIDIEKLYSGEEMFKTRLDLLVEKGWLTEDNGQYRCNRKGRTIARVTFFLQRLYKLKKTG